MNYQYQPEVQNRIFKTKLDGHLKILQQKTNLNRKQLLCFYFSSFSLIFMGIFPNFVSKVLTIYFPVLWSLRTIENKTTENVNHWLTYWSIFGFFSLIDQLQFFINQVFPFYIFVKTVILVYLYLPNFKGALKLYNDILVKKLPKKYFPKNFESLTQEVVRVLTERQKEDNYLELRDINIKRNRSNVVVRQKTVTSMNSQSVLSDPTMNNSVSSEKN